MIGLPMMLVGIVLRIIGWFMTPKAKPYKIDEDPEWVDAVAKETHLLNVKEAEKYARQTSRHIDPDRN